MDWANHINSKRQEDARIAEIERRSAPLFWLVYLLAFSVCCYEVFK